MDFTRLASWMDERDLPGKGEPLEAMLLSGGTQNEIYLITRGDERCVIRMPPLNAPADRDEGILREWRIVKALDGSDVPHTKAIAVCEDSSVLGRPFYLMGFIDGWSPMGRDDWPEPFESDLEARAGLGYQLAEGIALLSRVDWKARGLEGLGRPDNFHERQVDRWSSFFEKIKIRELDGMDVASAWLRSHKPIDFIPGIMHGDYQFANVMYKDGAPAKLAALIDWEIGTVGDPKLDLAWMVQSWPERHHGRVRRRGQLRRHPRDAQPHAGARALPQGLRPAGRRHRLLRGPRQVQAGHRAGKGFARAGDDPKLQAFGKVIVDAMRAAAELAETTDYSG